MAFFTIRLELNNHDDGDYDLLHEEMEKERMFRVVKGGDNIIYDMPPGTYNHVSNRATLEIYDLVTNAVKRVIAKSPVNKTREHKSYELIVTRDADGRRWQLNKNTDRRKLPKNMTLIAQISMA